METDWVRNYIKCKNGLVWGGKGKFGGGIRGASGIMLPSTPTRNASNLKFFSTLLSTFLERTVMR